MSRTFFCVVCLLLAMSWAAGDARANRDPHDDRVPREVVGQDDRSGSADSTRLDSATGDSRSRPTVDATSQTAPVDAGAASVPGSSMPTAAADSTSSSSMSGSSGSSGSGDSSGSSGSDSGHSGSGDSSGSSGSSGSDDGMVSAGIERAPIDIEIDADGRERSRGEVLFSGGARAVAAAQAAGFELLSRETLAGQDRLLVRLRVRSGSTVDNDIQRLRQTELSVRAEPNFVFRIAGAQARHGSAVVAAAASPAPAGAPVFAGHIGMVDTGVDTGQGALRPVVGNQRAFCGRYAPRPHGTLVAQILARQGMRIEVADVFQLDTQGSLVATAESVARGVDWLEKLDVPVINISVSGPDSIVLSDVIARAAARGILVVAAVGNDGPAAPPAFPAAMPAVVGVTAVDEARKVYRRAGRGPQVDFSALGVRVPVLAGDGTTQYVSGTSYASPLVASIIAARHRVTTLASARAVLTQLQASAIDLGARGRDPVFGWGVLAVGASRSP